MNNDWFKIKKYSHIGLPITHKELPNIKSYINDKDKIVNHTFFPLIKRIHRKNKYKLKENSRGENIRTKRIKKRALYFSTHIDSIIYSFYSQKLNIIYNSYLIKNGIDENITAYRKRKDLDKQGKCNIDFAKDVFDYIIKKDKENIDVAAITFDIKGFFDNLDHKLLKLALSSLLQTNKLDNDFYKIYRSTIKYSYIDEIELFNLFKNQIICKTKSGIIKKKKISHINFMRDKMAIAYCKKDDIKLIQKAHIIKKGNYNYLEKQYTHKGIPQGLPISATFANIYMINFDKNIVSELCNNNILYRRYSDDIIVICPKSEVNKIKDIICNRIKERKLEIEESKTNIFYFIKQSDGFLKCYHSSEKENKPLEYLGFSFDGQNALLKNASIGKYYQKMHNSLVSQMKYASFTGNKKTHGHLFINKLIKRYTLKGSKRHLFRQKEKVGQRNYKFKISNNYRFNNFGNYLTYVNKSAKIFNSKKIFKQLHSNLTILKRKIDISKQKVEENVNKQHSYEIKKYGKTFS